MNIGYDAKRIFHNTTGLGNYSRDLVRILSAYYPDNKYLLYNPKPSKLNRLKVDGEILIEKLPCDFMCQTFSGVWRSRGMVKDLKKDQVAIYHGLTGELPYGIHKTNIKTVLTVHDLIYVRYPKLYKAIDRKIYVKKAKYAAEKADVVVAISAQTKRDIVDFLKIDPEKIKVIYQGCHSAFKEEPKVAVQQALVEKYDLPVSFILNVGSVIERKNLMTLVKAVEQTGDHLVVVGSGDEYHEKIQAYIAEKQLGKQIRFLTKLSMEEIAMLYQLAEIFVYPSIFEGFGIPIIEAMYSKTPVITSSGSCFPEAGGPNSFYLRNPHDVNELVETIKEIRDKPVDTQIRIEQSYAYVQRFNDEVIAGQMMDLYKELMDV